MSEPLRDVDNAPPVIAGGSQLRRVPKPGRQASYDGEVKLLIRATQTVMLSKGCTDQPKIAEIVREAGMSNQAFYRHFRSRDDIIVALYEQGLLNIHAYLKYRVFKQSGFQGRLAAWIDGVLAQIEDPDLSDVSRVIIWNMGQIARTKSEIKPVGLSRIRDLLCDILIEGNVPDPERTAMFIQTLVMGLTTTYLEADHTPIQEEREHLLQFCLKSVTEH